MFDFLKKSKSASGSTSPSAASAPVDSMRRQAQARLVGSLFLVGVAVVGFPMVFDTEPRPLDPAIPVVVQKSSEVATPVAEPVGGKEALVAVPDAPVAVAEADPPNVAPSAAPVAPVASSAKIAATTSASKPNKASAAAPASAPPPAPAKVEPTKSNDGDLALALLEGKSAKRYVVQVGSFSEKTAIRDARAKLERSGIKTYAQQITRDGKVITRVRIGPYTSEDEARNVLAKVKKLGFQPGLVEL